MKFKFDRVKRNEWHEKFAWVPTKVNDEDDKHTYVFFEKYMQKRRTSSTGYIYDTYSKKEYFKRKLKGEVKQERDPWTHDGTDARIQTGGSVNIKVAGADGDVEVWDDEGNVIQTQSVADDIVTRIRERQNRK